MGKNVATNDNLSSRSRVKTALDHNQPDRTPVDFLATPEIWQVMVKNVDIDEYEVKDSNLFIKEWEAVLRFLQVDCRRCSSDQFYCPPESTLKNNAIIDWYGSLIRSTPNRFWSQVSDEGYIYDLWNHCFKRIETEFGSYDNYCNFPLEDAKTISDVKNHDWPKPEYWDYKLAQEFVNTLDFYQEYHIRFRVGGIFETAWQLTGMTNFLTDLITSPKIPEYIMDLITDIHVENIREVSSVLNDRLDMIYFYDDVASQKNLLMSRDMWMKYIRPRQQRIIDEAKEFDIPVMYHSDGAISEIIPDLIDMGVDLLNPIQCNLPGMDPKELKSKYGNKISFHGGIDIQDTLPHGTPNEVQKEVLERISVLGENGGYIMSSSHHIQPDSPIQNVLAMYDLSLR